MSASARMDCAFRPWLDAPASQCRLLLASLLRPCAHLRPPGPGSVGLRSADRRHGCRFRADEQRNAADAGGQRERAVHPGSVGRQPERRGGRVERHESIAAASAGANTVNVSFTVAAIFPDIRILEYAGLDAVSPVDVIASATGTSATSSTPAAVTNDASELLFAANTVATTTAGSGAGWTSRVITFPDGDIAEDQVVSVAGSYGANAPLSAPGPWVMQMVAFKAGPSAPPPPRLSLSCRRTTQRRRRRRSA